MEVDRIEKQFDDCIAFLLRVSTWTVHVLSVILRSHLNLFDAGIIIQAECGSFSSFSRSSDQNQLQLFLHVCQWKSADSAKFRN